LEYKLFKVINTLGVDLLNFQTLRMSGQLIILSKDCVVDSILVIKELIVELFQNMESQLTKIM